MNGTELMPAPREMPAVDDVKRYPLTGRFLLGRVRHAMSEREKEIVEGLIAHTECFDNAHTVLQRGVRCERSTLLIEGYMIRVIRADGQRHIVGIQVPGDFVDLHAFALQRLDHDIVTIGPAKVGYAPHERLQGVMKEHPHLTRLLWFSTLLDAAIHREWIMKMEQLRTNGRIAHLFAEIWMRLDLVGLAHKDGFTLPLTQSDLADACGTTAIHMNRVLRQLSKEGILDFRRGCLTVSDRAKLEEYGHFNPDFLYGSGKLQVGAELAA